MTTEDNQLIDRENYFLNFDIKNNIYLAEAEESFTVTSDQNLDLKLIFTAAHKTNHSYPHFYDDYSPIDSVDIIGIIQFEAEGDFGFDKRLIDFEIGIREDIKNLNQITDNTYTFKSYKPLYHQLMTENFGYDDLYRPNRIPTIFISLPDIFTNENDLIFNFITSNGFIFPHEDIDFNEIKYNERSNMIELSGTFDVDFKKLSCGYYSNSEINNAEFNLLIN